MRVTESVCVEIVDNEEKLEARIDVLEEAVASLKEQNVELRHCVNGIIEELNAVITLLNTRYDVEN